ncbi:ribonuclease H-like domain-containing protein [Tanacetum coccineum]
MADQDTPPPTITAMKIPIIKKGEYDIWSMRMRQYICHTYHNMWDIIVNGEQSSPPVPKTAKQLAVRKNQERIKSILLLAIPDEYLLKFHNVPDAKSLWAAIKSRFGGNEESKKMQKNVLKHQFENFVTASNETLDKAYDRFQKLISQLEIHGAYVSKEDINQKFLRSLPPSWSQIALIMRNKPDIDEVDIDDLYNNLRVYEDELKRSLGSNSASQNLAFLSSENTNSTNEVSTANGDFGVSTAGGINQVPSTPSAHDIAYSFLAQPTTSPQLENEDFQQMDGDDLEELDLRWQVAMLTVRVKKFIQRTGRNMDFKEKRHVSLDKSKIECYNCHRKGHFARECRSGRSQGRRPYGDNGRSNAQTTESSSQALVAQDGLGGYDWSNDFEVEPVNYALMAISSSSSSSSSDSEVQKCSKCLESFKCLQKNYDTEREKHNKAKLEIRGYEIALESLEARILGHEKNELAWGERYEFQNYDLKCREIKINNLNLELEKVVKERDELKLKIEKWEGSSKNLTKILNSQMSTHDKNGLGFGTQMDDLSNKSETDSENSLTGTIFEVKSSDEERPIKIIGVTKANEYHAITSIQLHGTHLTPIEPDIVSKSKINRDEVIIEDWTSDDEDDVWWLNKTGFDLEGNPKIFLHDHAVVSSVAASHMNWQQRFVALELIPKSLQVNSGRLLVNSMDLRLILMTVGAFEETTLIGNQEGDCVPKNQKVENSRIMGGSFRNINDDPLILWFMEIHEREFNRFCPLYKIKEKSTDKGKDNRRRARSYGLNKIDSGLDAEEEINTGKEEINTGIEKVSTGSTKIDSGTASERGQRERKAPMKDIRGSFIRSNKRKEKLKFKLEAQFYTEEDWDTIRAKLEANAELSKDVLG